VTLTLMHNNIHIQQNSFLIFLNAFIVKKCCSSNHDDLILNEIVKLFYKI
jgi:hypothetical protein